MPMRKYDKKSAPPCPPASDQLDLIDEALESCRAVETISTLLDIAATGGELQPALAAETGWMIGSRTRKLRQTLVSLRESAAKRPSQP